LGENIDEKTLPLNCYEFCCRYISFRQRAPLLAGARHSYATCTALTLLTPRHTAIFMFLLFRRAPPVPSGESRIFSHPDYGNLTRTEGVWAYGRILCIILWIRTWVCLL